ncbi:MAG: hypothetical protein IJ454_04045 [Clostridia bacterium]|nr:hypothetical protein [Clostridia bacterium]
MELTEIRSTVFGFSKRGVCQYISELNDIHCTELEAQKASSDKAAENYESQIKQLSEEKNVITAELSELKTKFSELSAALAELEEAHKLLKADYSAMERETEDLRGKSDVISTAIINAEKCASSMINDANVRAQDMIDEAQDKVKEEVKRLETAKTYISEVRSSVETALRKIDAELGSIVTDIGTKAEDITSERRNSIKEKFGVLDKFKRA